MHRHAIGLGDGYRGLQHANRADKGFGWMMDGTDLLQSYMRDGTQGVRETGSQMLLDKAISGGIERGLVMPLVRRAVISGTAGVMASGGATIAFEGGVILGGWARDNVEVNGKTLGGHVDDAWFAVTPDVVKERLSGVKQVDIESDAYWQQLEGDVARRRRQIAFDRVQSENAQQQAQLRATEPAPQPQQPGFLAGPSATQLWLDALNQSSAQRQPRTTPVASVPAAPRICTLDPKTGCHPGHDEKSHPGGCKAC